MQNNTPNNNPHAQENFSDNVESIYKMKTGEGGTMDLYEKHFTAKVEKVDTEISDLLAAIRERNPANADEKINPLAEKQKTWTDYYSDLSKWMETRENYATMARSIFDNGMAMAENVINKLDGVAADAYKEVKNVDSRPKTYQEKMSEHYESEALESTEVAGYASQDGDMHIVDLPQNWKVTDEGVLVARPKEKGEDAKRRPVVAGRNRMYIKSDVTEFTVQTSQGAKLVKVEKNKNGEDTIFRITEVLALAERKEKMKEGKKAVETAVDAAITVETAEGEPKPEIKIELDVENNEAHEDLSEVAEADPVAADLVTAGLDGNDPEDVTVTVDEKGNTVKVELEDADEEYG